VAGTNREITFDLGQSLFQVEGGPELTFRRGRAILFAHALPGYGVWALENSGWFWKGGDRESGFSLAIGGGADVRLARHFGLRLIQVDYTPLWQGAGNPEPFVVPSVPPGQSPYHNFRLGFGVIFSSAK
jgi:hypothetical protein